MKHLFLVIKGFIIGFLMMIPGLSGGSLAIMLGVYELLLSSVANIQKKKCIINLLLLGSGAALGLFSVSFILTMLQQNPYLGYAVVGIVFATIFSYILKMKKDTIVFILIGALCAFLIGLIKTNNIEYVKFTDYIILFLIVFLLAIGLILPGISFSYLLLTFNLHDKLTNAIVNFDYVFLILFGIMLFFWILITSKALSFVFTKYPNKTDGFILGFLIMSLKEIKYDFQSSNVWIGIPIVIICFVLMFYFLIKTANKEEPQE